MTLYERVLLEMAAKPSPKVKAQKSKARAPKAVKAPATMPSRLSRTPVNPPPKKLASRTGKVVPAAQPKLAPATPEEPARLSDREVLQHAKNIARPTWNKGSQASVEKVMHHYGNVVGAAARAVHKMKPLGPEGRTDFEHNVIAGDTTRKGKTADLKTTAQQFVAAHQQRKFKGPLVAHFGAYLKRHARDVGHNVAVKARHRDKKVFEPDRTVGVPKTPSGRASPVQAAHSGEIHTIFHKAAESLPNPKQRAAIHAFMKHKLSGGDAPLAQVLAPHGVKHANFLNTILPKYREALQAHGVHSAADALADDIFLATVRGEVGLVEFVSFVYNTNSRFISEAAALNLLQMIFD